MEISFIIVDDRELDCYIAEKMLEKTGKSKENKVFSNPLMALEYIKTTTPPTNKCVILLDIMMPVISGFEFVEIFEALPKELTQNYHIVAITTSLNKNDINTIHNSNSVVNVLKKPYTLKALVDVIDKIQAS